MRTLQRSVLVVVAVTLFIACGDGLPPESADSTDTTVGEVKVKVHPKVGNGFFKLLAPDVSIADAGTSPFEGAFLFNGQPIAPGAQVEVPSGAYTLSAQAQTFANGGMTPGQAVSITVAAGTTTSFKLSAIQVRFDRPLTFGAGGFTLQSSSRTSVTSAQTKVNASWSSDADGLRMLVFADTFFLRYSIESSTRTTDVTSGALTVFPLRTQQISIGLDEYDAAYPTASAACEATLTVYDPTYGEVTKNLRAPNGAFKAVVVVPEWSTRVNGGGFTGPYIASGGYVFNRIEVDDVEVAQSTGSTLVRGTFALFAKDSNGKFSLTGCTSPTHAGVDVPNGTYRIVSTAHTSSGDATTTQ